MLGEYTPPSHACAAGRVVSEWVYSGGAVDVVPIRVACFLAWDEVDTVVAWGEHTACVGLPDCLMGVDVLDNCLAGERVWLVERRRGVAQVLLNPG